MCGIVGFITNDVKHDSARPNFIEQALYADALRGRHGTGVYTVEKNHKVFYSKDSVDAQSFLGDSKSWNYIRQVNSGVRAAIGHNRFATNGGKGSGAAHPFITQHVVLVHNGTLRDYSHLPTHPEAKVDSARLAQALSEGKSGGKAVLEKLHGAYALVWHDNRTNSIYIARNEERPLSYAVAGNNLYIASEGKMLEWILDRLEVDMTEPTQLFPKHIIHKWALKETNLSLHKPKITTYTPPKSIEVKKYVYTGGAHQATWWNYEYGHCSTANNHEAKQPEKPNGKREKKTPAGRLVTRALKDYGLKIRHGDIVEAWAGDAQPYAGKPGRGRDLSYMEETEIVDISAGVPFKGQIYVDVHSVPIQSSADAPNRTEFESYYCEIVGIAPSQDWMNKEDLLLTGVFKEVAARSEIWTWKHATLNKVFCGRRHRYTFNDTAIFVVLKETLTNREFDMWVKNMKCMSCNTPSNLIPRNETHVTTDGKNILCEKCRSEQNKVVAIH